MATIKSYTDLSQSKKLAKILPLESADMFYNKEPEDETYPKDIVDTKYPMILREGHIRFLEEYGIPCWSLAALLDALPNKIVSHETAFEGEDAEGINDIYHKCIKPTEDGRYMCCYLGNGCIYECVADNPVDACYEMILKLNELNLL